MILAAALGLACASEPADVTVEIVEAPPASGTVIVALWRDESTFLKTKPYRQASVAMIDGKASAEFKDVDPGPYVVSAFLDKNNNGKLDRNVIGKPKEPFGFSNGAVPRLGPPKWQDAKFDVETSKTAVTVHLK
jgi:uncharacterized protein (DUF2141 family)